MKVLTRLIFVNYWDKSHVFENLIDFWVVAVCLTRNTFHFVHYFFDLSKVTEKSIKTCERLTNLLSLSGYFFFLSIDFVKHTTIDMSFCCFLWRLLSPSFFLENIIDVYASLIETLHGKFDFTVLSVHFNEVIFAEESFFLCEKRLTEIETSLMFSPLIWRAWWVWDLKRSLCVVTSSCMPTIFMSLYKQGNTRW